MTLAEEKFWYLTEQGLWQWDHSGQSAALLSAETNWSFVRYQSGQLWLSGHDGLYSYQLTEQHLRSYEFAPCSDTPCLDPRQITDLQSEPEGLWLLTPDQLYFLSTSARP